jgi:inward rectifier potassium channel
VNDRPANSMQTRLVSRGRGGDVVRIGAGRNWRDPYHWMLQLTWPRFVVMLAGLYLAVNLIVAGLYFADLEGVGRARPGSFSDAFFFSVETLATIGYGVMYPKSFYANAVMTLEALFGMMSVAVFAGIVFARFSRPTARVLFSGVAVVAPYEGVPTLMFRAANRRHNQILEAQISAAMVQNETTAEGQVMRRFHDLKLARSRNPVFALTWTVLHPIDEASPLYGRSPDELAAAEIEIVVTLIGIDETFVQPIHARHSFVAEDLRWDARFVDILGWTDDGRRSVDFRRFDEVTPFDG